MSYPIVYVLARNCVVSNLNVRTESDAAADAELEALIGEAGFVLQNLIGVAVKRKKDHYSIFGGGRRLRRVHSLIDQGKLPEDFAVPVMVFPNSKDAIELSLAENQKLPMNPADECTAYRNIIEKEGKTAAQIAARFGKTERFVLGRLRLADLAEPVFEALRKGTITLDVAQAYGSTSDTIRQARVFEQLSNSYYRSDANEIRLQLATGTYLGADPKALLVGREAYLAAGGRIDSDLFSDNANERWIDAELVDRLAEEKLAAAAEATREREGFAEVRTVGAGHVSYRDLDGLRPVRGEVPALTQEQEARCAEIEAELEQIEEAAADEDGEGYAEDDEARTEALQAEHESIRQRTPVLTDEQKASAIAYLVIGSDGQPRLHHQYYVAPQPVTGNPGGGEDGDDEASDEAAGPSKPAMSQRLTDELATMKTELLAVHVANDPRFALDLGTFIMADTGTRTYGREDVASELRANAATPRAADFDSGTPAAEEWAKFDLNLDRSWTEHDDVRDRFDAFCTLPDEARGSWLGWAVARTLNAVPAGQSGSAFLDHLGCKLGIDVATWWRPTARTYFNRISKPAILDLLEVVGDADLRRRYATSRKLDLATSAEKLFAGGMSTVDQAIREQALAWVPDAMRFEPHEPAGANDDEPSANPDADADPGVDVVIGTDSEENAAIADAA